ncbi:MAG TPA: hypothetical protein VFW33_23455, partial [Gemmataceae bacterium]|nr:hypothetical protein [Gemmataceae bacterium]
ELQFSGRAPPGNADSTAGLILPGRGAGGYIFRGADGGCSVPETAGEPAASIAAGKSFSFTGLVRRPRCRSISQNEHEKHWHWHPGP